MKKFNVEIELTEKELELLRKVDWNSRDPRGPYGMTTEINQHVEKGVIVEYIERDFADSAIFLTEVGKQIIKFIN